MTAVPSPLTVTVPSDEISATAGLLLEYVRAVFAVAPRLKG